MNKPGINIQILSDSEVNQRSRLKEIKEIKEKERNLQDIYIFKRIQDIKNMQNTNQAVLRMKKQMEIKRNFEEIYKEVEQKTLEIEKKMFKNDTNFNTNLNTYININTNTNNIININTNTIPNKKHNFQNDINLLERTIKVNKTKNFIPRNSKSVEIKSMSNKLNDKTKLLFPKINS